MKRFEFFLWPITLIEYHSARKEVKKMKKLIGTALGLGMILAAAAPSFAATNVTMNNTGPYSINRVRVLKGTTTKVNNLQGAFVYNKVKSENNTGGNSATLNTNVTTASTGDATSDVGVVNWINTSDTHIGP